MPLPLAPLAVATVLFGAVSQPRGGRKKSGPVGKKRRGKGALGSLGSMGRRRKEAKEAKEAKDELPAAEAGASKRRRPTRGARGPHLRRLSDLASRSDFPYRDALETWDAAPWKERVGEMKADREPTEIAAIIAGELFEGHDWPAKGGGSHRALWRRIVRDVHAELGIESPRSARAVQRVKAEPEAAKAEPKAEVSTTATADDKNKAEADQAQADAG